MKTRSWIVLLSCVLLAGVVLFLVVGRGSSPRISAKDNVPEVATSSPANKPAGQNPSTAVNPLPDPGEGIPARWTAYAGKVITHQVPLELWGPFPKPIPAESEAFLNKHGHTAISYLAVYDMTNDQAWLDKALELSPDAAPILAEILTVKSLLSVNERQELIDQWKIADPKNPIPRIHIVTSLLKNLPFEALSELEAALKLPGYNTYVTERCEALKAFRAELGRDCPEADSLTLFSPKFLPPIQFGVISKSLREMTKKAVKDGNAVEIQRLSGLNYQMGSMLLKADTNRMLMSSLICIGIQSNALAPLPESSQADFLWGSVQQRLKELEETTAEIVALTGNDSKRADEFVINPSLVQQFLQLVAAEGELAANRWLNEKIQ